MPRKSKRTANSESPAGDGTSHEPIPICPARFDAVLFRSSSDSERWNDFKTRSIITGRRVVLGPNYNYLLHDFLQPMKWDGLLDLPSPVYIELVRYFYANLSVIDDPQHGYILGSYVKGKTILLNARTIAEILGIPLGDSFIYFSDPEDLRNKVDENAFYATLTGDSSFRGTLHSNDLLPKYRVLNRFLAENVVPKDGHYEDLTPFQSYVLYKIVNKEALSLPFILMEEMADTGRSTLRSLPFGAILTKVFTKFGVSLEKEPQQPLKRPISESSVSQMRLPFFKRKKRAQITAARIPGENLNGLREVANTQGEQHHLGFSRYSTMATPRDIGSSQIPLQDIHRSDTQGERLDYATVITNQRRLEEKIDAYQLETRNQYTHLSETMQTIITLLRAYPPPPPPPPPHP